MWHYLQRRKNTRLLNGLRQASGSSVPVNMALLPNEAWKLEKLMGTPGVSFSPTADGILCSLAGKSILLTDWNDIFITVDSFVDFDYGSAIPKDNDIAVFDIGANIGDTAIVFAANRQVRQVFSFEPLPSIYQRFMKNMDHNPALKHKVSPFPFGLGDSDATMRVAYPHGCAYCATSTENWHGDDASKVEENMTIRDAVPVITELLDTCTDTVKVMKLDCEGAEFVLLPHLSKHGLLKHFSLLMMEFHRTDPAPLVEVLRRDGFTVFWQSSLVGLTGRLYAAKAA